MADMRSIIHIVNWRCDVSCRLRHATQCKLDNVLKEPPVYFHLILIFFVLTFSSTTVAQNALGDGDLLDSSTSSLGRVNAKNNLPTGVSNIEIRNNRVLDGRGFNEGIGRGYTDTVGLQLLSDAASKGESEYLDALYNSPWYWNNWNQQSAQFLSQGDLSYYNPNFIDQWATAPKQMSSGRALRSYTHEWSLESARKFGGEGEVEYPDDWSKRQVDQYKLGQVLGSGSLPNALDTSPLPIGSYRTSEVFGYLAASPMTGVSVETSDQPTTALGFSAWDEARLAQDMQNGAGSNQLVQPWRTEENRLEQVGTNYQIDVSDQYNQVLQTIANRATAETEVTPTEDAKSLAWLQNQYIKLQNELAGIPFYGDEDEDGEVITFATPEDEQEELSDEAIDYLASALRHGEQLKTFSAQKSTRFDELVQLGEQKLAKGDYFDAQRRFNQALQFIPGHPLATAGLGHAKIGAGFYLSAGYVLQSLLSFQPEMIDVEYGEGLLPPRIELVRAAVTVKNRLDVERDAGTYAFLLAYIGHQLHDQEMVEDGLRVLQMHTDFDDPIMPLLRKIWLEEEFMSESQDE